MTPVELVLLALLGGFVALDATSVGQFMLSRPLVAGVLAGTVLGDPSRGLMVGAVLEVLHIMIFPIGGGRAPEAGPATVVAVGAAALTTGTLAAALTAGTLFGIVWGHVGGVTVGVQRHLNGRLAPDPFTEALSPGRVVRQHLGAIGLDFLRGVVVTLAGLVVALPVAPLLERGWPLDPATTWALLAVAAGVPLGILFRSFGGFRKRGLLFLSGLAAGMVGAVLL